MQGTNGARGVWIGLVMAASVAALSGCGNSNEFPSELRGSYSMSRLLGTDNVTVAVDANSFTMSECDVNCPDPVMRFTKIDCTIGSGNLRTCTVESADCTGTVEQGIGSHRSLDISLTAKPGLTGEAAEHRQVNCYQHSGTIAEE